ncbi:MAG: HEAT repeat domain-containing protein [Verrucomicrobiales bacterium]|nr:HEAT repeat domain-containing protein [Verrucomicrobiales bacterium]
MRSYSSTLRAALMLPWCWASLAPSLHAADHALASAGSGPRIAQASDEGRQAIRRFRIPKDWQVELIAAEPDLANPVAFAFDERERIYVVETFRHSEGVLDIRGRANWPSATYKKALPPERLARIAEEVLDADLACRTVEDRERMLRGYFLENTPTLERMTDRLKVIFRGGDGRSAGSQIYADGFSRLTDGLASGVLARGNEVWFANIPSLWRLRDTDGDGVAEARDALHQGFGVRVGFLGHDLHGLCFGPDGRLYFTVGDRGANVTTKEGRRLETPDSGAVFRCDPDGSNLEIFATGLRNPQELVFDDLGNLWTGDNNSDGGDQARWTYLVEGGDCGWHIGWQFLEGPRPRGPWNSEGMWRPESASRIGYIIPALANIGAGPSGVTYGFGTGLPDEYNGRFFMVDFRGGPSGIWNIGVRPKGAGYEVEEAKEFLWNALPTDVEVGPDGGLYWADWVQGWEKPGKGRIYRVYEPKSARSSVAAETRELLGANLGLRDEATLAGLLGHADQRVRRRAQEALVGQGAVGVLQKVAADKGPRRARLHALWGLWQLGRRHPEMARPLVSLLSDADPEIRGQAARVLGDVGVTRAGAAVRKLLGDPEPRPRFFAAMALHRLRHAEAGDDVLAMLRNAGDADPFLRHAGVMGLVGTRTSEELAGLTKDASSAVRLAAVVALRRLQRSEVASFLEDSDPRVVLEAARAINDVPIASALPALAALIRRPGMDEPLGRRVLNANWREGQPANAEALAAFASGSEGSAALRADAAALLGHFAKPSGRDTVTGLWRPLAERDPAVARSALARHFQAMIQAGDAIQVAAVNAAAELDYRAATPVLRELVRSESAAVPARLAAIRALGSWRDPEMGTWVNHLTKSPEARVRAEAVRWAARLEDGSGLAAIQAALDNGTPAEKQAALAGLATIKHGTADALLEAWLERAIGGRVDLAVELDLLEASRARENDTLRTLLARYEASLVSTNPAQSRRYALRGGDAEEGRRVFFEREQVQCLRCHKISGEGGVVGPDLAGVGTRQTREYLLESIVHPNAVVAKGFENLLIETKDGREWSGTIAEETADTLVLNTLEEGPATIRKADITDRRIGLSSMPEGLADLISPRDLRNLVEYLASLKAP